MTPVDDDTTVAPDRRSTLSMSEYNDSFISLPMGEQAPIIVQNTHVPGNFLSSIDIGRNFSCTLAKRTFGCDQG